MSTHPSFSKAKEEIDQAWQNPHHTHIELEAFDVHWAGWLPERAFCPHLAYASGWYEKTPHRFAEPPVIAGHTLLCDASLTPAAPVLENLRYGDGSSATMV
jgi:hypothetical protein